MKGYITQRTKWTARLLLLVMAISGMFTFIAMASQSRYLGTNAALGSPLVSDQFVTDNWNPWEMLTFGIFLSNFAQPFEDDYTSAFTEGANYGTAGRGLQALQFAAGGDASSAGYLKDMVEYCKVQQSVPYKEISVKYNLYEYNKNTGLNTGATRRAYFDDLMPLLTHYQLIKDKNNVIEVMSNALIPQPQVVFNSAAVHSITSADVIDNTLYDKITYVEAAMLPTFYAGGVGEANPDDNTTIFDLTDNWDVQVLKALFAKSFNEYAASNYVADDEEVGMDSELSKKFEAYLGQTCPLVMDCFGNICMIYNGKNIIIIPASTNQYMTESNSYNYLNSLVLNNYVLSDRDTDGSVVNDASIGVFEEQSGWIGQNKKVNVGNFPMQSNTGSTVSNGKLFITTDTDTDFMMGLYKELSKDSATFNVNVIDATTEKGDYTLAYTHGQATKIRNFSETFNYGMSISKLIDKKSLVHMPAQFQITGSTSKVDTKKNFMWITQDSVTAGEKRTIGGALGALGLLSTLNSVDVGDEVETLDYFYNYEESTELESTKKQLFGSSIYLSPTLGGESVDAAKQFVNYSLQSLSGQRQLDTRVGTPILDEATRQEYISNLEGAVGATNAGLALMLDHTEKDTTFALEKKSSVFIKSFYGMHYPLNSGTNSSTVVGNISLIELDSQFNLSKPSVGTGAYHLRLGGTTAAGVYLNRVVRVHQPNSIFNTISAIFSLSEGCQFELYSTKIYVTYLEFYGMLGGAEKLEDTKFNQTLFKGAKFVDFQGKDFKNGVTQEEMEEATKMNVFKLLSLDSDGDKYRGDLFKSMIKTTFVYPMDEKLEETSVGNVGVTSRFLDVEMLEDNFLIGDLIKEHWGTVSIILFGLLSIIAIVSGAFNNRSLGWYLSILIVSSTMVYAIPFYLDISPIMIEKYINSAFQVASGHWAIAESIQSDKNARDLANNEDDTNLALSTLSTLNFLDTDSALMVKQDISQKVISNSAVKYDELQRITTARWLLPSLMQQMSDSTSEFNYISVPTIRLYNNYAKVWLMYHQEAEYVPVGSKETLVEKIAEKSTIPSSLDKEDNWQGGYKNLGTDEPVDAFTGSITRRDGGNMTHSGFYLLKDLKIVSAYETLGKTDGMTKKDWEEYAELVRTDKVTQKAAFVAEADKILGVLNNYNQYKDTAPQSFAYLWTTENLGTYFYTLAKDTFNEDSVAGDTGKNLAYIMLQLQGTTADTADGGKVRTSFMHYDKTGNERDICDMEEVFTNLMPYMYQMMVMANGTTDHNGFLGSDKMVGNAYYSENYKSWMFRTNWVTKIYEDSLFTSSTNVVARDASGAVTGEYTVKNISDPRSYPIERPMVFSEAQMVENHLTESDLTYTELCILSFNADVVKSWTTLINYANMNGMEKENVYREMAMEALFAFNKNFNRDNVIMRERTMQPTNYDLRQLSFITLLRSLTSSLTKNSSLMTGDLALTVYTTYGFFTFCMLSLLYFSMQVFALFRELFMAASFLSAVMTLVFNFMSTSTEKFKSMLGWLVTSVFYTVITVVYYIIINFLIGNPRVDTLVNISTITSSKFTHLSLALWGILLAVLSFGYVYLVIWYFYQLWVGHKFGLNVKDGGFAFYHGLANSMASKIAGATQKLGNKLHGSLDGLKGIGPGAREEVNIKNKVKTEADGGDIGTYRGKKKANVNSELSGADMSSNFNSGEVQTADTSGVTQDVNGAIEKHKKQQTDIGVGGVALGVGAGAVAGAALASSDTLKEMSINKQQAMDNIEITGEAARKGAEVVGDAAIKGTEVVGEVAKTGVEVAGKTVEVAAETVVNITKAIL